MLINTLKTLPRDLRFASRHLKSLVKLRRLEKNDISVCKYFDSVSKKQPEKVCFYFENEEWTFKRVEETSNRIGNFFSEHFKKDDVVALIMGNRPEYVCTWLGLNKIGVTTSLINFNLRGIGLKSSFEICRPKAIICGYEFSESVNDIYPKGQLQIPLFGSGDKNQNVIDYAIDLDNEIARCPNATPTKQEETSFFDNLFYIYTSGTTGLPKAAVVKNAKFIMAGIAGKIMNDYREDDILYTTLPWYHTAAGLLTASAAIISGCSVVMRTKFSAQNFWKDCIRYKATGAQYMGETCRYLLRQPPSPEDKEHKVRWMYGNGLRPEIWTEFVTRFNIEAISEIYGSTEGNTGTVNIENRVGAVGTVPLLFRPIFPLKMIKLDESGEPFMDPKTGLHAACAPGEPGELVCRIENNHPFRDYKGYANNEEASNKKIIHDVFKKGDSAFRSGDLMEMDELGFLYFKDRLGDTFRWKAENVSTSEVEYIISGLIGFKDCVAYGVVIPGSDGKAGMVAIADPSAEVKINDLKERMDKELPEYARPLFIRIVKAIEITGTHKMKKNNLQDEGYDLTKCNNDVIYFRMNGNYVLLDETLHAKIVAGEMKL